MKERFVLVQEQDNIYREHGHHLSKIERRRIDSYHKQGLSNRKIASLIGVCPQTINNEMNRGKSQQVKKVNGKPVYFMTDYVAETAQMRYEFNRKACHRHRKLDSVTPFISYFFEDA